MDIAQFLIENGADTKAQDNNGKTPSDIAIDNGKIHESFDFDIVFHEKNILQKLPMSLTLY